MKLSKMMLVLFVVFVALFLQNCGGGGSGGDSGDSGSTPTSAAATPTASRFPLPFSSAPIPSLSAKMMMSVMSEGNSTSGTMYSMDAANWRVGLVDSGPSAWYSAVSISSGGGFSASCDLNGNSQVFERSGRSIGTGIGGPRFVLPQRSGDRYAWTADEKFAYYGVYYDGLYEIDAQTGASRRVLQSSDSSENHTVYDHSIAVSPDNKYFVWFHHEWGHYLTIYVDDPSRLPTTYDQARAFTPWLRPDGSIQDEKVYDENTYPVFIDNENMVFAFTIYDGGFGSSTRLFSMNVRTGSVVSRIKLDEEVKSLALSRDRKKILVCGPTKVSIVETGTWQTIPIDDLSGYSTNYSAEWSPDDLYFTVATSRTETDGSKRAQILLYEPTGPQKWKLGETKGDQIGGFSWGK